MKEVAEKIASLIYNQHLGGRKSDEIAEAILNLLKEQGWHEPVIVENMEELALTDKEMDYIKVENSDRNWTQILDIVAKAQLNKALTARRPCEDCGGSGKKKIDPFLPSCPCLECTSCPTCQGAGLSPNKILAEVCENQELPENPFMGTPLAAGFYSAVRLMITPKGGMVWRKTIE